jgi:uncharacterized protein YndB with AHSA1/START domain
MNAAPDSRPDSPGRAKDAGWDVGVRTTVGAPPVVVWQFLLGAGLPIWLGEGEFKAAKGYQYAMADGVRGSVLAYTEGSKVRMSWRPDDWPHDTLLQLTVKQAETGTTIGIHHEQLADRDERRMMLGHWKNVIGALDEAFE